MHGTMSLKKLKELRRGIKKTNNNKGDKENIKEGK